MTTPPAQAYFVPDGAGFAPTAMAKGPWGSSISGNFVGGMLGRAAEHAADPDLHPARLTVDLLRPVAMAPILLRTNVVRQGKRLALIDVALLQDDVLVTRASALFLRGGDRPPGDVWTAPVATPPLPPKAVAPRDGTSMMVWAYGRDPAAAGPSFDLTQWQHDGPKSVWLRDLAPLVEGEQTTPFVRAAMAGDVASSLTHYGTDGLHYINADYTLTLSRLPRGSDVCLVALSHAGHEGVGTGTAAMFDREGLIGSATATALANPGFTPRSAG